jgi:hypothetical protein
MRTLLYVFSLYDTAAEPSQLFITLTNTTTHVQYLAPGRLALAPSTTPSLAYPLQLVPTSKLEFFSEPKSLDILGMLKNPMVLMMVVSAGLMFVMPKAMVRRLSSAQLACTL